MTGLDLAGGEELSSSFEPCLNVHNEDVVTGSLERRTWLMARRDTFRQFLTNLDQPMPLPEKLSKLTGNLWRRVVLRQTCCGHPGEPGC